MKKLSIIVICLICCFATTKSFASLAATTIWEVRTAGAATNGGGFNPSNASVGTDYSQQDAAQDSGTDLASADGDAAPCVITSATHNFVAADNGNLIQITEAGDGFTLGFYEIVSTATNAATLDRACGSDGAKTGGDWAYGGAISHPNTIRTNIVAGNTIYIKNGTYVKQGANTFVLSLGVSGGNNTPIIWEGYNSSRGDAPTDTTRPYFDGGTDTTNCLSGGTIDENTFKYIRFARATSANITNSSGGTLALIGCKSSSAGSDGFGGEADYVFINFECNLNSDACVDAGQAGKMNFLYSYIHDNTNEGVSGDDAGQTIQTISSISESNGGRGFDSRGTGIQCINSIAYNNTGASTDGFIVRTSSTDYFNNYYVNCMSIDNGNYGFNRAASIAAVYFDHNIYSGNGTAGLNGYTAGSNDSTTDPGFTDASGGDFTITSSASSAAGTGMGSTIPGATGDYKVNIGVDQDDNTAAGGSSVTQAYSY